MHTQDELEESRMPLWEHLGELRVRIIRSLLIVGVGVCFTYYFSDRLVAFLEGPLLRVLPAGTSHLYFTGITDKFFVYLQVSVVAAAAIMSPFLLYQMWMFVSPALYRKERRFIFPFIFLGSLAFLAGLSFGFFVVIPVGYKFLVNFGSPTELPIITLTSYFSLTLKLLVAMGLIFEVPVLLVLLARFGFVKAAQLAHFRRHAILGNAILAAIITPTPDAFTMLLVMIPLCLLYEAGIVGVRLVERAERKASAATPQEPTRPPTEPTV
jgi:sec-independent protein translocase protein TatC